MSESSASQSTAHESAERRIILEAHDVGKEYRNTSAHYGHIRRDARGRIALTHANVALHSGECLAVIGASGSGKTTLTKIMLGLLRPSSGSVQYQGQAMTFGSQVWKALRRSSSMVFQDPYSSLDPRWTVRQSLREVMRLRFGRALTEATIEQRCLAALEEVGLDAARIIGRYPIDLSGGQAQRVAIARAIIDEPDILLADEPMSAVDVTSRVQILHTLEKIRMMNDASLSILLVSHDLGMVQHIADHIVVLNEGQIVEQGSRDQVIHHPQNAYTKALMRAAAM